MHNKNRVIGLLLNEDGLVINAAVFGSKEELFDDYILAPDPLPNVGMWWKLEDGKWIAPVEPRNPPVKSSKPKTGS